MIFLGHNPRLSITVLDRRHVPGMEPVVYGTHMKE